MAKKKGKGKKAKPAKTGATRDASASPGSSRLTATGH